MDELDEIRRKKLEELSRKMAAETLVHVTSGNFEAEVLNSKIPVIVDFWAEWCPPCKRLGPIFEELSREYAGKVKFCKVNTEEDPQLASQFDITGIPTMILFRDGEIVDSITGAYPKEQIKQRLDAALK